MNYETMRKELGRAVAPYPLANASQRARFRELYKGKNIMTPEDYTIISLEGGKYIAAICYGYFLNSYFFGCTILERDEKGIYQKSALTTSFDAPAALGYFLEQIDACEVCD